MAWILLAGCTAPGADFGFSVDQASAVARTGSLEVTLDQTLSLSAEAREALKHGVPLVIETTVRLQPDGGGRPVLEARRNYHIEYLPLSDHYRLQESGGPSRTFPRLRHVMAELAEVKFEFPGTFTANQWTVKARSTLLLRTLPPPMQLPSWLSAGWRHDSGWRTMTVAAA